MCRLAAVAAEPGAAQGQHRPQPLAAARDDMAGELRDQRHRALHALDDQPVDAFEVASEKLGQRVERRFADRAAPDRHPASSATDFSCLFRGRRRTAARRA